MWRRVRNVVSQIIVDIRNNSTARALAVLVVVVALGVLLVGPLNMTGVSDLLMGAEPEERAASEETVSYVDKGGGEGADKSPASTNASEAEAGTMVVRTANVVLQVEQAKSGYDSVKQLVDKYEGYVESSQYWDSSRGDKYSRDVNARLVVHVPSDSLDTFLASLGELGKVVHKQTQTSDVTDQYVDISARLKIMKAKEERFLELLSHAEKIGDILRIEDELWSIRSDIESLQARKKSLEERVKHSKVAIELREKEKEPAPETLWEEIAHRFRQSFLEFADLLKGLLFFLIDWFPLAVTLFVLYRIYMAVRNSRA